jgi:hypothetical protein
VDPKAAFVPAGLAEAVDLKVAFVPAGLTETVRVAQVKVRAAFAAVENPSQDPTWQAAVADPKV